MIQRVQTIWLLLAAIAGFFTTQIPLYYGVMAGDITKKYLATESLLLFALSIIASLIAVVAIFLFKNRANQIKFTALGIIVSIALIALEVWQIGSFKQLAGMLKGTYYWGALLPIAMLIFFLLASSNIRKDIRLIKSLDRFR